MKVLVGAFNQEKALVGAFSVIVKPMDRFTALVTSQSRNSAAAARLKSLLIVPRDAGADPGCRHPVWGLGSNGLQFEH